MRADDANDLDWYIDNVVVPGGADQRRVGPVRARQGAWLASAHRLRASADATPAGRAVRAAVAQGFVLTRQQVRETGVRDADLRRLVRHGTWAPCGHGMICVLGADGAGEPESSRRQHAVRAAAAAVKRRQHVVATASAAVLHGLPVYELPTVPELCAGPTPTFGRREGARVRFADLDRTDVDDWFGVPVTSTARTIVDLARFDPRSGLMAADAALHEGLIRTTEIAAVVVGSAGAPGIKRAREVLALASPLIESPLESLVHLALHDDRFPPPRMQFPVVGADGKRYRTDFAWPEFRLVLEADGRLKYRDDELWAEKGREIAIARAGWQVVRVRWRDLQDNWPATGAWLRSLMVADRSR